MTSMHNNDEYLVSHPRLSSVLIAVVLGLMSFALAAVVYLAGVHTLRGQYLDSWVWVEFAEVFPWLSHPVTSIFSISNVVIGISVGMIVVGCLSTLIRKRFYLLYVIAVFCALSFVLAFSAKRFLPRPALDSLLPNPANSAPSGHTALTVIAGVVLVMGMPRILRALASLWSMCFTSIVGIMVIYDKWHRPVDVITAILLVGGVALLSMAFMRASAMDKVGQRTLSASLEIYTTVAITGGICAIAYGGYIVWQIYDVIEYQSDSFARSVSYAAVALIVGITVLMYGVLCGMYQSMASPLTRRGLVGAPPAPPTSLLPTMN